MVMRAGGGHGDDEDEDGEDAGLFGGQNEPLDLREMPRYQPPAIQAKETIAPAIADLGLLALLIVTAFAVAAVKVGVDEPGCEQMLVKFDRRA